MVDMTRVRTLGHVYLYRCYATYMYLRQVQFGSENPPVCCHRFQYDGTEKSCRRCLWFDFRSGAGIYVLRSHADFYSSSLTAIPYSSSPFYFPSTIMIPQQKSFIPYATRLSLLRSSAATWLYLLGTLICTVSGQSVNKTIDDASGQVFFSNGQASSNWTHENQATHAYNNTESVVSSSGRFWSCIGISGCPH